MYLMLLLSVNQMITLAINSLKYIYLDKYKINIILIWFNPTLSCLLQQNLSLRELNDNISAKISHEPSRSNIQLGQPIRLQLSL